MPLMGEGTLVPSLDLVDLSEEVLLSRAIRIAGRAMREASKEDSTKIKCGSPAMSLRTRHSDPLSQNDFKARRSRRPLIA